MSPRMHQESCPELRAVVPSTPTKGGLKGVKVETVDVAGKLKGM